MNNKKNLRHVVASLVTFMLLIASRALAQTPAGSVTSLTGDVHIERAGTTVTATQGMAVDVNDRLVTGPNSRVTITLTDNSRIELDESTSLVIDQQMVTANSRNTKLSLFRAWYVHLFRTRRRLHRTSRYIHPTRSRRHVAPNTIPRPALKRPAQ